jgi:hypothetical protein
LIDCRLRGKARSNYILNLSTGKPRPLPLPSNRLITNSLSTSSELFKHLAHCLKVVQFRGSKAKLLKLFVANVSGVVVGVAMLLLPRSFSLNSPPS